MSFTISVIWPLLCSVCFDQISINISKDTKNYKRNRLKIYNLCCLFSLYFLEASKCIYKQSNINHKLLKGHLIIRIYVQKKNYFWTFWIFINKKKVKVSQWKNLIFKLHKMALLVRQKILKQLLVILQRRSFTVHAIRDIHRDMHFRHRFLKLAIWRSYKIEQS